MEPSAPRIYLRSLLFSYLLSGLLLLLISLALYRFRLKEQLDEMKECGFEGTIFHPRYYPDEPAFMSHEYLDILSDTILHAKKLGLEFWIYDENGWPSGSGNGKVYEHFPDRTCDWLIYRDGKSNQGKPQ